MKQKKQASSNKSEIYNDVLQQQILDDHFYEEATLKPTGIQQNTFSYLSWVSVNLNLVAIGRQKQFDNLGSTRYKVVVYII